MGLVEDLGPGRVAVDTAPFIYFIEEHREFLPVLLPLFRLADAGRREIVTSALTLMEVQVVPYRAGNRPLAERYEAILTRSRGVALVELTHETLRAAAQLRALTNVRTPDALQITAALQAQCAAFVTNDRRLPNIPGLHIINLSDYVQ